ncbi:M23 family metallopeptidase [Bacillus xiapuensis]|uniref:M23 family metallopeptidase n=1 Tax=Bacillus xiapuensis TaxID=2014075 RepID=UPI000C2320E1|nr:M23 family metallopeptidase [Bacillus xiapuensis]
MEEEKELLPLHEEPKNIHPLFSLERFVFKVLASAAFLLIVAILYKHPSPVLEEGRMWFSKTMEKEFQFSKAAEWYESAFGEPLPFTADGWSNKEDSAAPQGYALPASGRILEDFQSNGKGIIVETGPQEQVKAIKDGTVIFAGKKEELGETVIVQHPDDSESWYGHLTSTAVQPYQQVKAGSVLAYAKQGEDGGSGGFYLAIKKGGQFVDPNQVIPFE